MANKKYLSLDGLSSFLDNLKTLFATKTEVSNKADTSHSHEISDVTNLQSELDNKSDSTHNHDSDYDSLGSADTALENSQTYTDTAVATKTQVQIVTWGADD